MRDQRPVVPASRGPSSRVPVGRMPAAQADPRVRARLEAELACLDEITLPRLVQTLAMTEGGTAQGRARRAAIEADVRKVRGRTDAIRRSLAAADRAPGARVIPAQARLRVGRDGAALVDA